MSHSLEQVTELSPAEKRALLAELLRKKVARGDTFPLSFAQQRLWILEQLEAGNTAYNISLARQIFGYLNIKALQDTLNEIVRRHEILRTSFVLIDDQPMQKIAPRAIVDLLLNDLRQLDEAKQELELKRLAAEEADQPFDLTVGPLFRARLLLLNEEEQVLLLTMHHIVSDGWSMGVLFNELTTLYRAFSNGEPSPLKELPIQYADFAVWQREWLRGQQLEEQLSYWKNQLSAKPAVLDLPLDRPRGAVRSYRGSRESILFSEELTGKIKKLTQREGATLFMTLL